MRHSVSLAIIAALVVPVAAHAQFSDSYNFLKAVREGDVNKVRDLASKPGSIVVDTKDPATGETALIIVVKRRNLPWVNFLLDLRAKPDLRDKEGNSPLMAAAQIGFAEGAESLLRGKATVDLANNGGVTPLMLAVQRRDTAMVRLLLSAGANPDKRDRQTGLSARDYAKNDPRGAAILRLIEAPRTPAKPVAGPGL
jgi:uncharacterized protein